MKALLFLYQHLDHFRTRFGVVLLAGFIDGCLAFCIPIILADFTRGTMNWETFGTLVMWLVILQMGSILFQWIMRRYGESLAHQFSNHVRLLYFEKLRHVPYTVLQKQHSGYILSLINKVADSITSIIYDQFYTGTRGLAILLLFFLYTARESLLVAAANLGIMVLFVSISLLLSRQIVPYVQSLNKKRSALLASYSDLMANILTIKKLGLFSYARTELTERTTTTDHHIQQLQNFHAKRWAILHTIFAIAGYGTIAFMLYQITAGLQSPSVLILFMAGFMMVKGVVERLSESFKNLMDMRAYIEGIEDITTHKIKEGSQNKKSWKQITFKNVVFRHEQTDKYFSIPDFELQKGDCILITGVSGQGKSTFLNLVANFVQPQEGARLVDGKQYEDLKNDFFEEQCVFISQETELFNATLRKNITLDMPHDAERLDQLLEQLHLREWVSSLEQGLDTVIGEKGVILSAGQKQRVNLLRGLLLDRDIYLLDEPTSHLDQETEEAIVDLLKEHLQNKTAIIVSHRDALLPLATKQYHMERHTLTRFAPSGR